MKNKIYKYLSLFSIAFAMLFAFTYPVNASYYLKEGMVFDIGNTVHNDGEDYPYFVSSSMGQLLDPTIWSINSYDSNNGLMKVASGAGDAKIGDFLPIVNDNNVANAIKKIKSIQTENGLYVLTLENPTVEELENIKKNLSSGYSGNVDYRYFVNTTTSSNNTNTTSNNTNGISGLSQQDLQQSFNNNTQQGASSGNGSSTNTSSTSSSTSSGSSPAVNIKGEVIDKVNLVNLYDVGMTGEKFDGSATVLDHTISYDKEFYTIKTTDSSVYYLVVDHSKADNNVYMLREVNDGDMNVTYESQIQSLQQTISQLQAENQALKNGEEYDATSVNTKKQTNNNVGSLVTPLILLGGLGGLWYFLTHKEKFIKKGKTENQTETIEEVVYSPDDEELGYIEENGEDGEE